MTKLRLAALALVAVVGAGCAGDLPPRSLLQDLRVLALLATPLDAGPGESVRVSAYRLPPRGATIATETWSFCPFTVGASGGDVCAVPACERRLDPAADGTVSADPGAEAASCLATYGVDAVPGSPLPTQVPDQLQTLFRYVVTASDGSSREAVLRVPFYPRGAPADRNAPPAVTAITIGGQPMSPPAAPGEQAPAVPKGGQLEVRVTLSPDSVQRYQDSSGRTVSEQLFVSFFTTDGRFDYDRGVGLDESVNLKDDKVADRATPARVYVVAHDDRGGAAVFGPYAVPFSP
ncbi:hypothetical protein [Anaeromyxobacter diazotrophicus]|uniref:Lipoprotein n=1 Tax=Anaeromyxobacter diazotrophicus TaxID=2590199 RepID=A0A7I9VJK4_9BACT|nr:hypothetical protein [Anaeromyxobacter diazotrophicus]GEJ56348.1 hypothetical protein AMYX_10890 [Anaeromyxobacter diazotrophicus]